MALTKAQIQTDYGRIRTYLSGAQAVIGTAPNTVVGTRVPIMDGETATVSGANERYDFGVRVSTASFTTLPQKTDSLVVDGVTYRVMDVRLDQMQATALIMLRELHRGV